MPFPTDLVTIGTPPRELDDPFIIDEAKAAFAAYDVLLSVTAPLLSNQTVTVELQATPPGGDPATLASSTLSSTQGGGLSLLSLGTTTSAKLAAFIPAGYTVELVTSGSGSATYQNGTETY